MGRSVWILTAVFAGMAGAQVLEWLDLDDEIKTAGLKDVSGWCLAFRSLIVSNRIPLPLQTCTTCTP